MDELKFSDFEKQNIRHKLDLSETQVLESYVTMLALFLAEGMITPKRLVALAETFLIVCREYESRTS